MKVLKITILIFLTISLFLQSCSSIINQPENIEFPSKAMLAIQDLPRGWHKQNIYFEDVPDAESITIVFLGSTNPHESHILISHQLSAYRDEVSAQSAFPKWKSDWLSSEAWEQPETWSFQPKNSDDLIEFGCINQTINEKPFTVCTFIQLHKNLVSLVLANIDGETLTIPEFQEAISALDTRLNKEAP